MPEFSMVGIYGAFNGYNAEENLLEPMGDGTYQGVFTFPADETLYYRYAITEPFISEDLSHQALIGAPCVNGTERVMVPTGTTYRSDTGRCASWIAREAARHHLRLRWVQRPL